MPNWNFNHIYQPVFTTDARYIDIWGGRGRGGSHFVTDFFLFKMMQPEYFRGVLMRSTFSDIRESLFRDLKDRINEKVEKGELDENDFDIAEVPMTVKYKPTGNFVYSKGFKKASSKQSAKLKSLAGVTHVAIEETEEVEYDDFLQLDESLRTKKAKCQVFRIFNPPPKNHWLIKGWYNLQDAVLNGERLEGYFTATPKKVAGFLSIFSTHKDNIGNLDEETVKNLLSYGDPNSAKYNPHRFYVVTMGLVSEGRKGRIYSNWKPIPYAEFKNLPYPSIYGLDFGYSGDPTAFIEIKQHGNKVWLHELICEKKLLDAKLAKRLRALKINPNAMIVADSEDPKTIQTFRTGVLVEDDGKTSTIRYTNMVGAVKGPGSVNAGIGIIENLQVCYTEESLNISEEYQNYSWELGPDKEPTDVPEEGWDHTMDASRYGIMHLRHRQKKTIRAGG